MLLNKTTSELFLIVSVRLFHVFHKIYSYTAEILNDKIIYDLLFWIFVHFLDFF